MKRSPRLTPGLTRTLNPKLERFIRVNPTDVEFKPHWDPKNGKWLKRASFITQSVLLILSTRANTISALRTHCIVYNVELNLCEQALVCLSNTYILDASRR